MTTPTTPKPLTPLPHAAPRVMTPIDYLPSTDEDHEWNPLDPAARWLFYAQALSQLAFFWLPVSVAIAVVGSTFLGPAIALPIALLVAITTFVASLWLPSLAFDRWGWALANDALLVRRGVIIRAVTSIPTHRIQHVDTRQGLLERWLGLARLQVYTASGVGGDGVIPGLTVADADNLRDTLVAVRGDDGV